MKTLLALITLLTLSTTQTQAADFPSRNLTFEIKSIQVHPTMNQYNGRLPYTEVFDFITSNHLDLVDPAARRQWCDRWQPANVNPVIFQSRATTEKAIKNMMRSLNRKHDFFLSPADTARQKAWLTATNTVTTKMLPNNIAYIKIPSFLPKTVDREAQQAIAKCGQAQALILDLRGNTGGLVQPALNVAATLIPQGIVYMAQARVDDQIVQTKWSLEANRWVKATSGTTPVVTEYSDRTQLALASSVPMVVLVDGQTASAAELLTGALKANRRAVIMGTRTYGKGTGNKLMFLSSNGRSLQVTHEKLFPGGLDTDGTGILPDVQITQLAGNDYQLQTAVKAMTKSTPEETAKATMPSQTESRKQPYGGSPYVRLY